MLTWQLGARAPAAPCADADVFLAGIVDAIGESDFGTVALRTLNHAVAIDFWSVYCLPVGQPASAPPRMYVSGALRGPDVSGDCFRSYRGGLWRADRTFSGASRLAAQGAAAMTLWNEAEIPSPHRDRIYRRHDIRERLSIVGGEAGELLAVNLYRYQKSGSYREREIDGVQSLARSLYASVRKHIRLQRSLEATAPQQPDVAALLQARCPALTRRELEVCARLLRGWTYDGIAADLGLSPTSVKTYRGRAFDRLGIHFRSELFSLVLPLTLPSDS
ncbi:LuxR family transcriptional regulator [Azoarcus indigens]|uniref:Regulatory LuxR family protein n=1 Tax=Azoarcus indigens TaxID=29545 RepID=A0A4R6EFS2_9RHOO|nr:helix-turn-helix transcriptional regulator [Azoarcus indigens]NMG63587.1 LuxR family transcriptional regulator [Azoarcus indigens]TDN57139.1 regulatory LuxR family protein [Azoarcus indigens]